MDRGGIIVASRSPDNAPRYGNERQQARASLTRLARAETLRRYVTLRSPPADRGRTAIGLQIRL